MAEKKSRPVRTHCRVQEDHIKKGVGGRASSTEPKTESSLLGSNKEKEHTLEAGWDL